MIVESLAIIWALVALWIIYHLTKKLTEAKRREQQREETLAKKEAEVIAEARQQAKKIIAKAVQESAKIEPTTEKYKQELKERFDRRLRSELEKVQKDDINLFKSISKDTERDTQRAMLAELEKQKAERLKKLDGQIVGLVRAVAEKVLGRSLSLETHEELIFEALEQAKKERMFR